MPTDPAVPAAPRAPHRQTSGDGGFSLVEVLTAIAVIATVMTAAAPFLISSVIASDKQGNQQVAIQLATDALERARALEPRSLLSGRGELAVKQQWDSALTAVKRHLATMRTAWDPTLLGSAAGRTAPLPTAANPVSSGNNQYTQNWYVGTCWQDKLTAGHTDVGDCTAPADPAVTPTGPVFLRVLVAVTWNSRRPCPEDSCVYVASMLASVGPDPLFETKQPAPVVTPLSAQTNYTGDVVSLPMTVSGGTPAVTWSATGLPSGLTLDPDTGLITGTPSAAGTSSVQVTVTDADGRLNKTTFTWTVIQAPSVTNPGTQTTRPSTYASLAMLATGGAGSLKWSATGLPAGLTINPTTGLISGTTSAATLAYSVTVTVTDTGTPAHTASVSFQWIVATPLTLFNPGQQTMTVDDRIDYTLVALGGIPPYTWQASNMPVGLSIDRNTGRVTGTVQYAGRYVTTVTVTDSAGATATMDVVCIVSPRTGADLRVTTPDPDSNQDRSTALNTTITSFTADSKGANPPSHTWSATGLPPGITITSGGVVSGKPTVRGEYRVTLIVTSAIPDRAVLMFDWTVT
jgi:prepilin-type N-terminal cleavage/methylation domain-containing protein